MQEIWKPIPGWQNYEASNLGNIRSIDRIEPFRNSTRIRKGRVMKQRRSTIYNSVNLKTGGRVCHTLVHRLVALAFIPNENNLPVVNHKDCDPLNNRANNLEWSTQKDNIAHAVKLDRHVKGVTHGCHKLSEDDVRVIRSQKKGIVKLAEQYGVTYSTIKRIRRGKIWKHLI